MRREDSIGGREFTPVAAICRVIYEGLCRKGDDLSGPVPGLEDDFFDHKVADFKCATEGAAPAEFHYIRSGDRFSGFTPVTTDDVRWMMSEVVD